MKLKRILAMVLCVAMVLSMMGTSVFAEGETPVVTAVAKIGETEYASVADALSAAQDGDEIVLCSDVADVDATINKNIILNLGGKTVTDAYIIITGDVTIKNGSIKNANEPYPLVVQNNGKLTIDDVDIEASKSDRAIWVRSSGELVFNSGSILATKGENNTKTNLIAAIYTDSNTDVTINGGTITVDTPDNKAVGIYGNYTNANVTVNGGKISTSGKNYSYGINVDGDITVNGGEIVTNEKGYGYSSGIRYGYNYALVSATGDVTITDGTITTNGFSGYIVNVGRGYSSNPQTVTITGGTLKNDLSEVEQTTGGHKAPALVWEGSASPVTATITDGDFSGFSADLLREDNEETTLSVSGGTFDAAINEEFLVDGFEMKENTDGTFGIVEESKSVAKIGDTGYETLEAAFKAATEGCTIEILTDVTIDYKWDSRYTGSKFTKPVTINGNDHTLTFTGVVNDGYNQCSAFRFEDSATVKNLKIDMTNAVSEFNGRFRAISAKGDLTVDNCEFIGNGSANNTRAIIFGEGAGAAIGDVEVVVTNSKFTGWRRGVSDNENAQDAKTVVVIGNTFTDADVAISATDAITVTDNIVTEGYVSIKSYTESENLVVTATGNTLTENVDESNQNYIDVASKNVTAQDDFSIIIDAVAKIGDVGYASVADALSAAQDGDVVNLIWEESDDPIAMNGSVYGKSVTITGTATVDWSKGNLFVGRGGEGDGTVIFDGANLASASDQASIGIHVSGREKETSNKYNGTLIIKNSTIELDYLINRGTINVDNSMLTVKKGFGIAGRPASETESGEAATATINITNNSYVKVLNHNGMGIGVASATPEGKGILNLTDSTFECASFNVDADLGDFNVSGESTLKIAALTGKEINLLDGTILKDSIVGGHVLVLGVVTFRGDNTVALVEDYGNAYSAVGANWTVEAGASLTMTEKARWGFGYGDKATIIGTLTDASTARESLTEDDISLFTHGFVAMSSWDVAHSLVVKDAYVVIGDNNSFGNTSKSGYKGTYDIDFDNAVMDASRITFYEAGSKTDLSFVDSDVKVGTFMTRDKDSTFTLTNTKLLSTTDSNGTDEGNYHAGTMTLNNSDITYSAPLVMENGTLMLGISSNITAPVITGAGVITVDASELKNGSVTVINADMSGFTGTVTVTNNDDASYKITDAGLVVSVEAPSVPTSTHSRAYTSENTYWGECGGNASESFEFKFYHDDTYMGYTSLNNIGGIIDGDVYVSWHIKLDTASNTDEYWDMAWEIAPTLNMQPNRVEHWIDGVKAAECVIEPNWSDSIHPVVAAVAEADGKIVKYVNNLDGNTLENALTNAQDGQTVALLRDVKLSDMVMLQKAITIDGNGFSIKPADANKAYNSAIYFHNAASGTIKDVVFDGWKSDHVIRIQGVVDAKVDTVTIKNSNQTSGLALISSTDSNTEITSSTFVDNTCLKVIDINSWGDGSTATAKVSGNTFKNNTTTSTGVIYYAVGGGFELSDNTFESNTVNANGHGSVVYFSDGANCSVTGNTFKNNAVTATDKRAGGALVLEEGTAVSGNAFIGNTASSAEFAAQVLYKADEGSAAIDLSDNYWGGEEPGAADYATVKGAPITVGSYYATINEDGTLAGLVTLANPVAKIGETEYASVADALADAQAQGLTDVTITLVGETTKESTDSFDLCYKTALDKVTFKQEDPSKAYYIDCIYTGKRTNNGTFVFDGVNIVVTGQYIFEGNVKLTNNSVIKSVTESNCFVYSSVTTVEPGSKLQGVIDDLRGGTLIVDGGRNDGEFNTTPDMQDSILIINWSGDSMTLKNGAYVKINAANEVGRLTVNSGTSLNVYASKLDSYQWIANNGTINTDVNSVITTKELKGAGVINVDASELKNGSATVINADMSDFTGTVSVTNNDDATYAITDAGLVISVVANASVTDSEGNVSYYATLSDALSAAQDGDTITVIAATSDETVDVDKSLTITGDVKLENVAFNAVTGCTELTVEGLEFTGNSWINSGAADKLTVSGVTADVDPKNTSYTNSRSAFISLGRSEQKVLELVVENCDIVAYGVDPILGWAAIKSATITGNTFGSELVHQTNSDSVKFMSIAPNAVFTITGNTVYSDYNGFVFGQNTTRDNAYTAVIEDNTFVGSADHVWVEVSGANTTHAKIQASSSNTVNGEAFTVSDVKVHPNIATWTGYAGVDVVLDENGKIIGGTLAEYSNFEHIADGYEVVDNGDGSFGVSLKGLTPSAEICDLIENEWPVTDTDSREAFVVQLKNVTASKSLKIETYSGDKLLATTILRENHADTNAALYPVLSEEYFTVNVVLSGEESGSWDTEWHMEPTEAFIPDNWKVYCDGQLVAEGERKMPEQWEKAYIALDSVKDVSKNLVLFDYPIVEIEGKEYYRVAVASGIKSTSYAKVGFEVTIGDAEAVELYSTVVYKNMTATFDGVDTTIPASEFGAGSQYINFANLYFNTELYEASTPLTIRPFAVKFNGDYEYGKETTIDKIYTLGN